MLTQMGTALRLWFGFTLLLGLGYPLGMTALSQWIFPAQANGSLVYQGNGMDSSLLTASKCQTGSVKQQSTEERSPP